MTDAQSPDEIDQPREVRRGHLTQYRARIADDRVRVEVQGRMHSFDGGTRDHGRPRRIWKGSLDEAERLHQMLELLLYDEEAINHARK